MAEGTSAADAHANTLLALPWYVNGTLEAHEKAEVERHLSVCPSCRAALAEEERLAEQVALIEIDDVGAEVAFRRLEARLGPLPPRAAGCASTRPVRDRLRATRWGMVGALAASLALAVAVGALGWVEVENGAPFRTLSDGAAPAAGTVRIIPAGPGGGAAVRRIADKHSLALVGGPSETGVWTLAAPVGADLEKLERRLGQDPSVDFALVESGP